jgi:hypothetical protein
MTKYNDLLNNVKRLRTEKDDDIKKATKKLDDFIKSQSFTGKELIEMRDYIVSRNRISGGSDDVPRLELIIDRVMTYKEE